MGNPVTGTLQAIRMGLARSSASMLGAAGYTPASLHKAKTPAAPQDGRRPRGFEYHAGSSGWLVFPEEGRCKGDEGESPLGRVLSLNLVALYKIPNCREV